MEAIGIGDLHLTDDTGKGGLSKYIESPDRYVMSEVERVIKWGLKKGIKVCLLYGDLSENPRMSYEGQIALATTIKAYPKMQFIAILGNHDKLSRDSAVGHSMQTIQMMDLPNFRILTEDCVLKLQGTKVNFCPWPSKAFNPNMLNVGHTEVHGSKGDSGRVMAGDDLSKSKAIVCMGHLHTNHQVRNTYFSGTLYQTNFGEPLPKFFHHINFNSTDDYEINSIPFDPLYKLFNCVVESQADVDALPTDSHHLIKLVVQDGADVVVPNRPNIVLNKTFKTKSDLATILTEDLMQGQELVIKTSDFFIDWIKQQSVPQSLKKRAARLRKEILGGTR